MVSIANSDFEIVVRCRHCKWWRKAGCAIAIVDKTDMPGPDDYCSFATDKREAEDIDLYDPDEYDPDENPDDVFEHLLLQDVQAAVKLALARWKRRPK